MPNHVSIVVVVSGPESDVSAFEKAHFKPGRGNSKDWFDFETIIPMPKSVANTVSCNVLTAQQQADQEAAFAETGFRDWYEWSYHNWGTKWNSYCGKIEERTEGRLKFRFETAWSFPDPIFEALLVRYSTLRFDCLCFDEGDNFAGKGQFGVDFECCQELVSNELYAAVYGEPREHYED